MSKKFRCGRLLQTSDGRIKKLDLGSGGGTRTCDWSDEQMTFDEVHDRLLTVFDLSDQRHQTTLYDFKHQPLDFKQFSTFADYMKQYGLNRNSTVVYICESEKAHENSKPTEIKKKTKHLPAVVKEEPEPTPVVADSASSIGYSFANASLDLTKNMRELISQNPSNRILTQLFEKLWSIHGHVLSIIVPLQQLNENSNGSERLLYLRNLNNVHDLLESTKIQLNRNHDRFCQMKIFPLVEAAFLEFYDHVQILRNRWGQTEKTSEPTTTRSSASGRATTNAKTSAKTLGRKLFRKERREKLILFRPLLAALKYLSSLLQARNLLSFRTLIQKASRKVKSERTRLNLLDHSSIENIKTVLFTIKNQLVLQQRQARTGSAGGEPDRPFIQAQVSVLKVIRSTISALYSKQAKMLQNHQNETTQS